jgi:hypothetical protein
MRGQSSVAWKFFSLCAVSSTSGMELATHADTCKQATSTSKHDSYDWCAVKAA